LSLSRIQFTRYERVFILQGKHNKGAQPLKVTDYIIAGNDL